MSARKQIYYEPLHKLSKGIIDLTGCATPQRFRWVDAAALVDDNYLRIVESDQTDESALDEIPYASISYVWRGEAHVCDPGCLGTFRVVGKRGPTADPISIDVLRTAAIAARDLGAAYLWLDRLCIMQAVRDDKDWQIMNMGDIYRCSTTCLIFPGGVQRLVALDEETTWILRAWTLQEAVLPPRAECVIRFEHIIVEAISSGGDPSVYPVEAKRSGRIPLHSLLQLSMSGRVHHRYEGDAEMGEYPVTIFGTSTTAVQLRTALLGIWHCGSSDPDGRENYMWRSALLRTTRDDVDNVFSVMGLFDIRLDPAKYPTRETAAIGLAQAILARGGRANWIMSANSNTLPLPKFPKAQLAGSGLEGPAVEELENFHAFGGNFNAVLVDTPTGSLADDGTLKMSLPMARVRVVTSEEGEEHVEFLDSEGNPTGAKTGFSGAPGTHALLVGKLVAVHFVAVWQLATDTAVVLVEKCGRKDGMWHRTGVTDVERSEVAHCFKDAAVAFSLKCCDDRAQ
ncbi:hypothetical protein BZA05DRAFT_412838 [Tricharina praecox]|uniref:uncharacterized protein n=1 Tax=Tricharina praecox TaxID=43433 RepID=UPI0022211D3A|nr:uncharacterized protein BZA05DRAFT_412838 [Tricharina praecox]KAI5841722.1 hypothetical protein BZA05DRAFT_412838 [Tricharina praecox]